jgi:hypothetical protein
MLSIGGIFHPPNPLDHPDKKQMAKAFPFNDENLVMPFTFPRDVYPSSLLLFFSNEKKKTVPCKPC